MRRSHVWLVAAAVLGLWNPQGSAAIAGPEALTVPTPAGYTVVRDDTLHPSVRHVELANPDGPQRVHVAAVDTKAGARIVPVLASDKVAGPEPRLERTSSMCVRVACVVGVNADFYNPATKEPVGAFAAAGELLRSPVSTHHQLAFDREGRPTAGVVSAAVRVVGTDLQELTTPHLNVARGENSLVLYSHAYGASTRTNPHGTELVGRINRPKGALRIGQTSLVTFSELRDNAGDTAIPRDGVVLSGHGIAAEQLRQLWQRAQDGVISPQLLVRVETSPALTDTVGGVPVLVREGRSFVSDDGSVFMRGRHPRTVVGWTAAGVLLLVTVDGRQPGYAAGLSLLETAELMIALGAVEALNLDGGGSTTFVTRGAVANRPSDQLVEREGVPRIVSLLSAGDTAVAAVERPTISGLMIVIGTPAMTAPAEPPSNDIALPVTVDLPVPTGADPASSATGNLPALVGAVDAPATSDAPLLELLAALLTLMVAAGTAVTWRRQNDAANGAPPAVAVGH